MADLGAYTVRTPPYELYGRVRQRTYTPPSYRGVYAVRTPLFARYQGERDTAIPTPRLARVPPRPRPPDRAGSSRRSSLGVREPWPPLS